MDKKRLTQNTMTAYNEHTLAKSSVGFDSPIQKADTATNLLSGGFLCPDHGIALSFGRARHGNLRVRRFLLSGLSTCLVRPFCLTAEWAEIFQSLSKGGL